MWNFKIGRTFGLMFSTLPFIALRTAVYFGSSLLLILGFVGGPLLGVTLLPESMGAIGFYGGIAVGGGVACTIVYFLREYFLYLVKAGHIAVLVELMEGRKLPKGQMSYAKSIVSQHFVTASSFFVIDQVITGVLGVVNRLLVSLGSFIPGMGGAMSFLSTVLRTSLGYADEVILALSFKTRSGDVWRTSRDGVVLYAQNYQAIFKNAIALAIINYLMVFVLFILAWGPASWIAGLMPGAGSALIAFVVTLLLVYSFKKAFIEPFLMAALMQVYFHSIEGQVPNPEWADKLDGLSEKFRSMKERMGPPREMVPQVWHPTQVSQMHASQPHAQAQPSQPHAQPQPQLPHAQPQAHASQPQPQPQPQPSQWYRADSAAESTDAYEEATAPLAPSHRWHNQISATMPSEPALHPSPDISPASARVAYPSRLAAGCTTLPMGLVIRK